MNVREKWAFVPAAAVPEALSRVDGWQGDVMDGGRPAATAWKEVQGNRPWLQPERKRKRGNTKPKAKPKGKAAGKAKGKKGKKGKGLEGST